MIEITGAYPPEHRLKPGDVVMVSRQLQDKKTKEYFEWKFFAVITKYIGRRVRPDGPLIFQYLILDEKDRGPVVVRMGHDDTMRFWYLDESEWPDGVHAFRTKFILEGRLDAVM